MQHDLEDDGPNGVVQQVPQTGDARLALLHEAGTRMASTLDVGQVGRNLVEVSLRRFADAVGVYMVEHLIVGDDVPRPATAGRSRPAGSPWEPAVSTWRPGWPPAR